MSNHKDTVDANLKLFNEELSAKYQQREAHNILPIYFIQHLLNFDLKAPRRTLDESSIILGDPDLPCNGLTIEKDLPDPKTFISEHPDTPFKPGAKILDFACGPGMVTELLAPYLKSSTKKSELIGMDINPIFLKSFEERAEKVNDENLTMKSYEYDILDDSIQDDLKKFENYFDVIVCTISYHHIYNYEEVTKKLVTFLKKSGWLFIVDFYNEDVELKNAPANAAVQHMGGLKTDKLNYVLGDYSGLKNVSSAREFRTWVWNDESFICSHMNESVLQDFKAGKLRSREDKDMVEYLVPVSLIYAVGQKE
ncbi:unnamed protein product [Candida verbasci]|uniref:Methyltransferase domain-containing protein n=1 Tax=Candida verbasci TaxID=1227364 RepID=A0A9W4TYB9_9ASCO|nr:unnamed protein product [Candida verbasci]